MSCFFFFAGGGAGRGFQLRQSAEAKKKQLAQDAKDRIAADKKAKKEVCFGLGASSLGYPFCSFVFGTCLYIYYRMSRKQVPGVLVQIIRGAPLIRLPVLENMGSYSYLLELDFCRAPMIVSLETRRDI